MIKEITIQKISPTNHYVIYTLWLISLANMGKAVIQLIFNYCFVQVLHNDAK